MSRTHIDSEQFILEQYSSQMKQLDAEALYTFIAAVVVTLVFWLSIFLTHDSSVSLMHLPLWFVLSCLGGYAFSVLTVIILVKFCLKSMALKVPSYKANEREPEGRCNDIAALDDVSTQANPNNQQHLR